MPALLARHAVDVMRSDRCSQSTPLSMDSLADGGGGMRGSGGLARARATSLSLRGGNSFWTTADDYDGDEDDKNEGEENTKEKVLTEQQPAAQQRALLLRQVNETVIKAVGAVWLLLAEEYTRALQSKVNTNNNNLFIIISIPTQTLSLSLKR